MKSTPHIDLEKLTDLAEDRQRPDERSTSMQHLSSCSRCSSELDRLRHLLDVMRTDNTEDVPRDLTVYANNLFSYRARQPDATLLRRIIAVLSFDSLTAAPAFGVRSGGQSSRQLLFSAEETDLDLRLAPRDEGWVVSGQVLGKNCAGGEVALEGVADSASTVLNELCEFALPPVPGGSYRLRIRLADVEVEVPELDLKN